MSIKKVVHKEEVQKEVEDFDYEELSISDIFKIQNTQIKVKQSIPFPKAYLTN